MAKYVLIVDDNEAIRRTLRYLFKENPEWTICGEATNGRDALEKLMNFNPI
jgi:YesN/AraC family two-component response regulator